jgi:hypothetical protein
MTVEELLTTNLSMYTGIKVYPVVKEQKASLPAIVYRRVSLLNRRTLNNTIDMKRARYQIDIYATTYKAVRELAELTKVFFEINQTNWILSYVINEIESTEDFLFRTTIDVYIEYK